MLNIKKTEEDNNIILELEGKLDTATSPDLKEEIGNLNGDFKDLILDFGKLTALSSAGLRVLLATHQDMQEGQKLRIKNSPELIMSIFDITGLIEVLNIE